MAKVRIMRRLGALALTVGLAGLVAGVAPAGATSNANPTAEEILGSGSDTTQFMMQALDGLYLFSPGCNQLGSPQQLDFSCTEPDPPNTITTENYKHDQVHEAYFLGSGVGKLQLCKQGLSGTANISFARSSSGPGSDCTGLHYVAYARDGLSWEAFNLGKGSGLGKNFNNQSGTCSGSGGSTQFCLTQSQLNGIFVTCSITSWSQVGGASKPFAIYTPQAGSGTRKTWDGFVGGDSSHCIPADQQVTHVIPENENTFIFNNGDQKRAIFPFSYGVWITQIHGSHKAILGAVDNVLPSAQTIGDGTFPFGRFLYNIYCNNCATGINATAATIAYVGEEGWLCKVEADHANDPVTGINYRTEIANTISGQGFVPIPLGVIGGGDTNQDYCRLFTT
jgi:phosphate transport system substrate-binding protein